MNSKNKKSPRQEDKKKNTDRSTETSGPFAVISAKKYGYIVLWTILLLTLMIRYAEPIKDGDFFWQIEYGRYLWENKTLVPDHGMFSWTPADTNFVYCAWIGELILYSFFSIGGLPLLFGLRYLCLMIPLVAVWGYARRLKQEKDIQVFFILVVVLLGSYSASFLKPEMLSMLFMAALSHIYFTVKSSIPKKNDKKILYLLPVLFLLWVNTHGVFAFGLIVLGFITLGEILNAFFCPQNCLPPKLLRHLVIAALLSLVATFVSPYGYTIHLQFVNAFINVTENLGHQTIMAYHSIFETIGDPRVHVFELWIIMGSLFILFFSLFSWKKSRWDWAILLLNVCLGTLFAKYMRSTYYWCPFWAMSLLYLGKEFSPHLPRLPKATVLFRSGLLFGFGFLALQATYDALYRPIPGNWFGFGINHRNPVQASEFLKKHRPGNTLYNTYDIGGYLLYDLFPGYKVFIDQRWLPYRQWYGEYLNFNKGSTPLDSFSEKYPFDVAVVDHRSVNAFGKF
ncbi:MAG: hypothetical protein GY846_10380, partial [Deltaproteobacteria bacterium]|nr:hypothetical protein [Deltaproteobacteria bacterium]